MKPKLILMSHGHYAEELAKSAQMIIGEIEGLTTIAMEASDGLEGTQKKLRDVFAQIGQGEVVIATDLISGTPCSVAVQATYERQGIRVLTGLNLPMAIEYALSDIEDVNELAALLLETGLAAVKLIEKTAETAGEEGYED